MPFTNCSFTEKHCPYRNHSQLPKIPLFELVLSGKQNPPTSARYDSDIARRYCHNAFWACYERAVTILSTLSGYTSILSPLCHPCLLAHCIQVRSNINLFLSVYKIASCLARLDYPKSLSRAAWRLRCVTGRLRLKRRAGLHA